MVKLNRAHYFLTDPRTKLIFAAVSALNCDGSKRTKRLVFFGPQNQALANQWIT